MEYQFHDVAQPVTNYLKVSKRAPVQNVPEVRMFLDPETDPNPAIRCLGLPSLAFNEGETSDPTIKRDANGVEILEREEMRFEKKAEPKPAPTVEQVLDLPRMSFDKHDL